MIVSLVSQGIPDLLPMRDRSPGIHHSDVLSDLCIRLGLYEKSDLDMTRLQLGCALEDTIATRYSQQYPDRYIRGEEMLLGDLPITLDLIDTYDYIPEEIKLTWISSRHDPREEKFKRFRWQVMSQCCAMVVTRGRLNITHLRGDYKGFEIHHNLWEYEWERHELENHKGRILRHRDLMLEEGWKS